jgi:hypothetical protein
LESIMAHAEKQKSVFTTVLSKRIDVLNWVISRTELDILNELFLQGFG